MRVFSYWSIEKGVDQGIRESRKGSLGLDREYKWLFDTLILCVISISEPTSMSITDIWYT